jgi:glutaredoxin
MCVGIGAPGTLREILRGYFGDKKAPERFRDDDVVRAGFVEIGPGVGPTRIGPLKYNQWFSDERGYQRPVELATVRLKNLVEVLSKWDDYVSNLDTIPQRGATYLFDADGSELYSYQSRGVLTYSETMPRPLTFLAPYIGEEVALNPLGLKDNGGGELKRGRGILKPAGKAMGFLSFLFKLENKLQAKVLGVEESDFVAARKEIDDTITSHKIVVYTYGLSPFSNEALAVLDEIGANYTNIELGLEWFLLDKEKSTIRAELLEMTGQSSLPHVFIDGNHIGGVFTGTPDGSSPGLAGLKESGELKTMIA